MVYQVAPVKAMPKSNCKCSETMHFYIIFVISSSTWNTIAPRISASNKRKRYRTRGVKTVVVVDRTQQRKYCLPPYLPSYLAGWYISTHSSYWFLAFRQQEAAHPVWSMPFESWRWCLAHRHYHSIYPSVQRNGERFPVWSVRCRSKHIRQWRTGRHIDDRQPWSLVQDVSVTRSCTFWQAYAPLYSRKLHILFRLDRTSWETSFIIFAFSFGERVVNHFASLYFGRISRSA